MPKPPTLTPKIHKAIVDSVRNGNYFSVACEANGVPESTGRNWLQKGRQPDAEKVYALFALDIKKAEADAEEIAVQLIKQAAEGRVVKRTKITRENGKITKAEQSEDVVSEWTAAAWYLERKHWQKWSKNQIDILQAIHTLAQAGMMPPEFAEMTLDEMAKLKDRIREGFRGILDSTETVSTTD